MSLIVLLAEDEPNIVESLTFLLERAGFAISIATDGRQAPKTALECAADLFMTKPFANAEIAAAITRLASEWRG